MNPRIGMSAKHERISYISRAETNRNLWASDASHFLYQETDADTFDVETHFFARWDTSSGINGLVVKSPADNNWVTLKFWARDAAAKGQIQYQTKQNENGNGLTSNAGFTPTFGSTELFFRLRKQGNTYTGWYKTGEADPWIEIGVTNFVLTPPLQLGIYAGVAAGTGTLTVDYAYFRSTVDTDVLASPVLHFAAMEVPRRNDTLAELPKPIQPRDMDSVSVIISIGCDGAYLCAEWQFSAPFVVRTSGCWHVSWQESCSVLGRQKRGR